MTTSIQIFTPENEVQTLLIIDAEKKISGSYQNIRRIPRDLSKIYGNWVEVLDLSHNKIRDVSRLRWMPNLHTLILDHNLIVSTTVFSRLPTLQVLWLNHNLISDIKIFIPHLARACPNLRYLSMMGNLASVSTITGGSELDQQNYRIFVISHFENLFHLDDKPITATERLRYGKRKNRLSLKEKMLLQLYDFKSTCQEKFDNSCSSIV